MSMCVINNLSAKFYLDFCSQSSPIGSTDYHSSVNALLARFSSLLHRFRPKNDTAAEPPQPPRSSAFHLYAPLARLPSLIHRSPPENDAQDELQPPSRSSQPDPRVLLARLSSLSPRSRLNTEEEAETHLTTHLSSCLDALISRLSSLFHSQPHTNEKIELTQRLSRPRVVEVAAVRDRQVCILGAFITTVVQSSLLRLWLLLGGHSSRKQNEHMSKLTWTPKHKRCHRTLSPLMPQHL
ncbi:hypothetical protein EDD22DRAFT_227499 [Suillus occidentalis]|nr:hypothetical protein EDD22DRAFT_227499 [Suillus occidentalis]